MSKNLYVGNLPYQTTEDQLRDYFGQKGQVIRAKIVLDHGTGQSKGFGFVEMENDGEAEAAINDLNNQEFMGRKLVVNEARPRENRPQGDRGQDRRW